MSKVTSKLQVTMPKAIAEHFGIRAGDELEWIAAGEVIRVIPSSKGRKAKESLPLAKRLELFDRASQRQRRRQARFPKNGISSKPRHRGWKREDLYIRGLSD
jgi:AbrB family looped-hinge helix DNA binding protein